MTEEAVQKIDHAMSAKADAYLSGGRSKERSFLELAKQLGERKTAIEIAKHGTSKPLLFERYSLIGDILLSVNEPTTYDALAQAIAWHGGGRSTALRKKVGQAIEPALVQCLKLEMQDEESLNKQGVDVRRIRNLVGAIARIGTVESIPVLQELAKSENPFYCLLYTSDAADE